jgi:hypothetical protein
MDARQKELIKLQNKLQEINASMIKDEEARARKQLEITKNRTLEELKAQRKAISDAVMDEKEKQDQLTAIDDIIAATKEKYAQDIAEMEKKYAYQTNVSIINTRILLAKTGSAEELQARKDLINEQLQYEIRNLPKGHAKRIELEAKAKKDIELLDKDYSQKELDTEQTNIENHLAVVKKGSVEEYNLKMQQIKLQRAEEVAEAENTGADIKAINDKYDKAEQDAFEQLMDERIQAEMKEAASRLDVIIRMRQEEEDTLLANYKNGLINKETYEKGLADIAHKYSVMELKDKIDTLQKILDTEQLSDEQRADIAKQLADARMALSDLETKHTISNIEEENAKRKKSAELAKELAQQAFEVAMEFLTQQSEAKIEELEAELERIDEWKEAELARLDESVMSEETRAAEKKRIEAEAEAQRKKIEEEKRQEQLKMFRMQQLQSVAQTAINTAESIVKTGAELGYPAAIPFVAMAAVIGAAQTAMILAQKPPQYAEGIYGDEYHKGGFAVVGDAGKKEYGLLPGGKLFETPAIPTLVDLPKYTQIFPDYLTMTRNLNPIPHYEKTDSYVLNFEEFSEKIITAINKNKAVQNVSVNLDNRGITYLTMNGNVQQRHTNSRVRRRISN